MVEERTSNVSSVVDDAKKIMEYYRTQQISSIDEAIVLSDDMEDQYIWPTKADSYTETVEISEAVYDVVAEYKMVDFSELDTFVSIKAKLVEVVERDKNKLSEDEYSGLLSSIDVAIMAMEYSLELYSQEYGQTRGFWDRFVYAVKCVAGTAGSAGLGVLAGSGVGTVTLPVIGTVSGAALGGWSGALVGVATFC